MLFVTAALAVIVIKQIFDLHDLHIEFSTLLFAS
jgi:hypothetical protein